MDGEPSGIEWAETLVAYLDSKELQQVDEPVTAEGAGK